MADPTRQDLADAACEVTPSLPRAVARLQAWCSSQDRQLAPGEAGPPIYFSDVRAVLKALEQELLLRLGMDNRSDG